MGRGEKFKTTTNQNATKKSAKKIRVASSGTNGKQKREGILEDNGEGGGGNVAPGKRTGTGWGF